MKLDILKTDKHLTAVFVLCLIVLGTVIRVRGLGKWCINSDEYFLFQSTSFIHDTGFPKFPSGGYYVRGIALQYFMAFTTWIFPNKEFGLRIIPLCFGILTIPMFFLFCKKMVPLIPSILCSAILLFSSWHIEFSRFARFYSTFQFIFFLFLYFFYIGNSGNEKKHNLLYWTVAFISVFIFEASIFFPIIIFIVVLLKENKFNQYVYKNSIYVIGLILINYLINEYDYKNLGVNNSLPIDMINEQPGNFFKQLPIHLPSMDIFFLVWRSYSTIVMYCFILFIALFLLYLLYQKEKLSSFWSYIFIVTIIFLPLFHLYALLGLIIAIIFSNRKETYALYLRHMKIINIYFITSILFWIGIIVLSGNHKKILHYLVGYPMVKPYILKPYYESIPIWGLFATGIFGISVMHNVFSKNITSSNFTLTVLLLCIIITSIFKLPEYTTRYSFFFFPLIILLAYQEIECLISWMNKKIEWRGNKVLYNYSMIIPLLMFSVTEDFNFSHIVDVSAMEANFRIGKYKQFQEHWYERFDYKSPALYVNENITEGDSVIIDSNPFFAYLTMDAIFFSPRNTYWFPQFSRNFGTEEIWSGRRMISDISSIINAVPKDNNNSLWVISKEDIGGYYIKDIAYANKFKIYMKEVGLDERFKVWQLNR